MALYPPKLCQIDLYRSEQVLVIFGISWFAGGETC